MPVFGQFRFGTAEKFGASGDILRWGLQVDWDDVGSFGSENEGLGRITHLITRRGRKFYLRGDNQGFEDHQIGEAIIKLDNHDNRYTPTRTSSPLYGKMSEGKFAHVLVKDGASGTAKSVFAGRFKGFRPAGRNDWSHVTMRLKDGWDWLRTATTLELQESQSTDTLLGLMLDDVAWPTRWGRDLGAGFGTVPYYWADGVSARNRVNDLANAELGRSWVGADGALVFRNRHSTMASVATLLQAELDQDIGERPPQEMLRNIVRFVAHPRAVQATGVLWTLQEFPAISAGGEETYWASFAYNNETVPAKNIQTLAGGTDYTANTQADGGGTDLTASISIVKEDFSESSKLDVTNNHGSLTAYITLLQVRGDAVASPYAVTQVGQAGDYATNPKSGTFDYEWTQNSANALAFADYLADQLHGFDPFPIVILNHRPGTQFDIDLNSRVTLELPYLEISKDYRVGYIEHVWENPAGTAVRTKLHLEPFANFDGYWQFTTQFNISSKFPV